MKRTFLLTTLTLGALFFSLVSFTPGTNASLANDVLKQTNKFRRSKGLPELIMNEDLNAIAQKHSENMAKGRVGFGHGGFSKRNAEATRRVQSIHSFAENVAYGASTGKDVVNMWKSSTGHRKNMLGRYKYIGIGVAKSRRGQIFYTQVFGG